MTLNKELQLCLLFFLVFPTSVSAQTISLDIPSLAKKEGSENKTLAMTGALPYYKGGDKALLAFLSENVKYPEDAINNNVYGKVVVCFKVLAAGTTTEIAIKESLSPSCDKEVLRVVGLMKNWIPIKGQKISDELILPVTFILPQSKKVRPKCCQ